jgi:hypothetical protein
MIKKKIIKMLLKTRKMLKAPGVDDSVKSWK